MVKSAAIYARVSQDREGDGLAVARQLEDCRAEAERRGWQVFDEYVDDDVSAYSGKRRPEYERMLADIRERRVDGVMAWALDRLNRQPILQEQLVQVCVAAGVEDLVTIHGDVNLRTGNGLLMARIVGAVAAEESDAKSRRLKRKFLQLAQEGKSKGGGTRPYGMNDDRVTLNRHEAEVIKVLADRFLAGESLVSITRWLQDSGEHTVTGKEWRTTTVRNLLLSPRISGRREHHGEIIGTAVWPATITVAKHDKIRAILQSPERAVRRSPRRYLLSGMLRCGLCGSTMVSRARDNTRRYVCAKNPDNLGCGRMSIVAAPVEALIAESVLIRLDTPALAKALAGRAKVTKAAAALSEDIAADTEQLNELAGLYAAKAITATEWIAARKPIEARLSRSKRQQNSLIGASPLDGLPGNGKALTKSWDGLNLDRQAAIVRAIVDHIVIHPAAHSRTVDLGRIKPVWRL
ncbi:MAG: recombinase family protein [Actinomycetes bacterium]